MHLLLLCLTDERQSSNRLKANSVKLINESPLLPEINYNRDFATIKLGTHIHHLQQIDEDMMKTPSIGWRWTNCFLTILLQYDTNDKVELNKTNLDCLIVSDFRFWIGGNDMQLPIQLLTQLEI